MQTSQTRKKRDKPKTLAAIAGAYLIFLSITLSFLRVVSFLYKIVVFCGVIAQNLFVSVWQYVSPVIL